ncbi:MAG: alpha/beta fold hydrolase [Candidatus Pacearchaeota archaeon]
MKTSLPKIKDYIISAPSYGKGQRLYNADLKCLGKKSTFCSTSQEVKSRVVLVSQNYNLNKEEAYYKNLSGKKLIELKNRLFILKKNLNKSFEISFKIKDIINESLVSKISGINQSIFYFEKDLDNIQPYWNNEEYNKLDSFLDELTKDLFLIETNFNLFNYSIYNNITLYNKQIDNMTNFQITLSNLQNNNLTENSSFLLDKIILDFNFKKIEFINSSNLSIKDEIINLIFKELNNLNYSLLQISPNETQDFYSNITIDNSTIDRIYLNDFPIDIIAYYLEEPKEKCCLYNICYDCCLDSCKNEKDKYPVIFLHGHNFYQGVSAEHIINIFDEIQRQLVNEGYINGGNIFLAPEEIFNKGVKGKSPFPITFKASYYFDTFKDNQGSILLQTKKDNIDTYAIRLNDIINNIKFITGRDKVIIVSHSMGGLVSRRYLQIFGENSVDKLIMIGTANNGISENIYDYCRVFGEEKECDDMHKGSLFMNKLSRGNNPQIPVYNLIGYNCETDGDTGDGVVQNTSAFLPWAKNYYINGSCNGFDYLHLDLVDPKIYPEVYRIINESLLI